MPRVCRQGCAANSERDGEDWSPQILAWDDNAVVLVVANNYDAGFGSAPTVDAGTGVAAGTETPAEVAGTGTACRE